MKQLKNLFALSILFLFSGNASALDLGAGYSCSQEVVQFKGKEKRLNLVKKALQESVAKQKDKIASLKKKPKKNAAKIATANATVLTLRNVITGVNECDGGLLALRDFLNSLDGKYDGVYSATLGNFKIEGSISLNFSYDSQEQTIEVNFGGKLGELVPTSKTVLTFPLDKKNFPAIEGFTGTTLGDAQLTIDKRGSFRLTSTNMPNQEFSQGVLTFEGNFSPDNKVFNGAFKVGSQALPGTVLLSGILTFSKS